MNNQERYDELDNIVRTLDELSCVTTDKYYKEMINELKYEFQDDLEEIENTIYADEERELRQMNADFERGRI